MTEKPKRSLVGRIAEVLAPFGIIADALYKIFHFVAFGYAH